jgi:site-specific recombinase XerD
MRFVYDRRKRATAKKNGSVELEIYHDHKRKYVTTGVRVLPRQWRNGAVTGRLDAIALNMSLQELMRKANEIVAGMMSKGELCIEQIPIRLKGGLQENVQENEKRDFLAFCCEKSEVRKYGKAEDSKTRYDRFLRFFREWGGIVSFDDITEANVIRMDKVLTERGLKPYSKWNNYHRFLNSFILDAIGEGIIRRNPYKHVRIEKDKSSGGIGKYLSPAEFEKIERMEPPTKCLERVRDLFVFQTYTCLSYVDLMAFDAAKIIEKNGRKCYVGNRGKTKQQFVFLLMKPALDVLDKYGGKLPVISNVKYNEYLKALAQHAGIDKPLSSHWARHTGATLLLNKGVSMQIVAKVCGHSSTKITEQVYAKLLDETVVEAMSEVE